MKKCAAVIILFLLLSGCSGQSNEMDAGMHLRSNLLQAEGCSFQAAITADCGDKIHAFTLSCNADAGGDMTFTVIEPKTIAGISGKLSGEGGKLTFDGTALHFELLTEDQLSPVSAPWILLKTLRSGFITSCCTEENSLRLSVDDSYKDDALRLDIWLDSDHLPDRAEILHNGRKILSVTVEQFEIL